MNPFIIVKANNRSVKVRARSNGTVSEVTLRSAFLLENDVPISLLRNEIALDTQRASNHVCFILENDWCGAEFVLCWEECRRSRQVKPIPEHLKLKRQRIETKDEELRLNGPSKPKGERIEIEESAKRDANEEVRVDGDIAASISRFALFYMKNDNFKRCAIPLTPRLAATFRHGENKSFEIGDEIIIRSWFDNKVKILTRAVKFIEDFDTIILRSEGADLCDQDFLSYAIEPKKGMPYLMMGFSIMHDRTNHQSLCNGIIASKRRLLYTGSSSSFKGDSGAGIWNKNGRLMGMQIEVEKVPHTKDNQRRSVSPASGSRCSIVAIRDIHVRIQDLLPVHSDVEWEE